MFQNDLLQKFEDKHQISWEDQEKRHKARRKKKKKKKRLKTGNYKKEAET